MTIEWMNIAVTLLAFAALWWGLTARVTAKSDMEVLRRDMDDTDEDLREIMDKLNERDDRMEIGFNRHEARLDAGLEHLDTKISANSQAHHADIMEVIHKIDDVANDLRAEIRDRMPGKTDKSEGRAEASVSTHTINQERAVRQTVLPHRGSPLTQIWQDNMSAFWFRAAPIWN